MSTECLCSISQHINSAGRLSCISFIYLDPKTLKFKFMRLRFRTVWKYFSKPMKRKASQRLEIATWRLAIDKGFKNKFIEFNPGRCL